MGCLRHITALAMLSSLRKVHMLNGMSKATSENLRFAGRPSPFCYTLPCEFFPRSRGRLPRVDKAKSRAFRADNRRRLPKLERCHRSRSISQMARARGETDSHAQPNKVARETPSRHISTKPVASGIYPSGYLAHA